MDWSQVKTHFEADGSLRDIYVFESSVTDWTLFWEVLASETNLVKFTIDGEAAAAPANINDVLLLRESHAICASFRLGTLLLNCHFFKNEEIELDLDPKEVAGFAEAKRITELMTMLGRVLAKDVHLTHENQPLRVVARYSVTMDLVTWASADI